MEPDFVNNPNRVITYVGEFDENKEYPYFEKIKLITGQIIVEEDIENCNKLAKN